MFSACSLSNLKGEVARREKSSWNRTIKTAHAGVSALISFSVFICTWRCVCILTLFFERLLCRAGGWPASCETSCFARKCWWCFCIYEFCLWNLSFCGCCSVQCAFNVLQHLLKCPIYYAILVDCFLGGERLKQYNVTECLSHPYYHSCQE